MSALISAMPFIFLFLIPNLIDEKEIISVEMIAIFYWYLYFLYDY